MPFARFVSQFHDFPPARVRCESLVEPGESTPTPAPFGKRKHHRNSISCIFTYIFPFTNSNRDMKIKIGFCCGIMLFLLMLIASCSEIKEPVASNQAPAVSAHPDGWLSKPSPDFHGLSIRESGWNLSNCQQCHGTDFAGGAVNSSCLPCHPQTPEDCIVCHGGVENTTGAPPLDLDDNVAVNARGVGTHTPHIDGRILSDGVPCATCHTVPSVYDAPGHVDTDLPAEVRFTELALNDGAQPGYDANAATCSNTYCHGNWGLSKDDSRFANVYSAETMQGNKAAPVWTDPATAQCGTCHDLPPQGHVAYELNQCSICHSTVDAGGNIVETTQHINGQVNVFGEEYPFF